MGIPILKIMIFVFQETFITIINIYNYYVFPIFNIVNVNKPKNSKKIRTCQNYKDELTNLVKLYQNDCLHYWVTLLVPVELDVFLELPDVVLAHDLFEVVYIE